MLELSICVVALVIAGWAIAKNYDAKVVLFATGLILLAVAVMLGHPAVSAKQLPVSIGWIRLKRLKISLSVNIPTPVSSF